MASIQGRSKATVLITTTESRGPLGRIDHYLTASNPAGADSDTISKIEELEPAEIAALHAAGYEEVSRVELLACTAEELTPTSGVAGLTVQVLDVNSSLADIRDGLDANELGFDPSARPVSDEQAEEFRRQLISNRAFVGRIDGALAAAGMFNPPVDGVAELVGITTLEQFRRRGISAFLTAFAARAAFDLGVDLVFLSTTDATARRVYERLGFVPRGTLVTLRAPRRL